MDEYEYLIGNLNQIDKLLAIRYGNVLNEKGPEEARKYLESLRPVLESNKLYTDKYKYWEDFTGDKYKVLSELYERNDGKMPTRERMMTIHEQMPFISSEDIKNYFDKTNEYIKEFEKQSEYEAGVNQRRREVEGKTHTDKDWGFGKNLLASNYSKQRYIYEPEKSIFSDEGEWYNKGEDVRDVMLGTVGAAGDMIPPIGPVGLVGGTILGPGARLTRDLLNRGGNYSKTGADIGKSFVSDLGFNIGVAAYPNLRRQARAAGRIGSKNVNTVIDLENTVKSNKEQLAKFDDVRLDKISNTDLYALIDNLEEGELKNSFKKYAKDPTKIDRAGIADELDRQNKLVTLAERPDVQDAMKRVINKDYQVIPNVVEDKLGSAAISQPELTKFEKVYKPAVEGTRYLLSNDAFTSPTVRGGMLYKRNDENVSRPNKNLTRDFLLGFVPDENSPIEIQKAYEDWREKYKKQYKVYPEEDTLARSWEE